MRRIELLCPAKNIQTAKSAILCGADAVYIGANAFGARYVASNPTDEIAELCDFAHLYGCRVCITLNTILHDDEIPQAIDLAKKLYDVGVDSLIIQDLGLLECGLPPMPLQASTQCHTTTTEKAKFLEACGFGTIVLARELSLEQIKEISQALKPDTRIECFVHGALCVSYSGQCRLSYAIGGRSGNRGECAQPCRMKYELYDADENEIAPPAHYLSLRDMNRSQSVGEMLDAGVDIFKIEGRLKDENYVKNTTAYYRKILDKEIESRNLKRASFGKSEIDFQPDPNKTFTRTFCEYHLHGTQKNCASFDTPKAKGEFIGFAKKTFPNGFILPNATAILSNGDGLVFEDKENSFGCAVRKIEGDKVYLGHPNDKIIVRANSKIFRNKNVKFESELEKQIVRKMDVEISVSSAENATLFSVKTLDERAIEASVKITDITNAQNENRAIETLKQNLAKLGQTPFVAKNIFVNSKNVPFLPVSKINAIRRELIDALTKNILDSYKQSQRQYIAPQPNFDITTDTIQSDELANVLNSYAEKFYKKFGINISGRAVESTPKESLLGKQVMQTKHCILRELNLCTKTSDKKIKQPLILKNQSAYLHVYTDCKNCGMNIFYK
ncbi:MAG: U32 family peptidase [Opitutales bacterium]|nr:U32 family peptidase [Opitutales bacterium]